MLSQKESICCLKILIRFLYRNVNFVFIHKITHNPTKEHDAASKTK